MLKGNTSCHAVTETVIGRNVMNGIPQVATEPAPCAGFSVIPICFKVIFELWQSWLR